jgi:protein SCO1/2
MVSVRTYAFRCGLIAAALAMTVGTAAHAQAIKDNDPALTKIDVVEHLGNGVPLDIKLTDDAGRDATLRDYCDGKAPVILVMGYYSCPMLCNMVLNGVVEAAKKIDWLPGREYRIVFVSINPLEPVSLAAGKKANYLQNYGKPETKDGWVFATAAEDQSRRLADAIGFKYYYDEIQKQYAHPAVLTILTGTGVVSRYLYCIEYKPRNLRMALLEASKWNIGSTVDRIILYCYHYDPNAGGYVLFAANVMKLGGAATLVILGAFLSLMWIRERKRKATRIGTVAGHRAR